MRRVLLVLVPLAVVGAVFAVAFMSAGELSAPRDVLETVVGEVVVSGDPLPAAGADAPPGALVGSGVVAPSLVMSDRGGAEFVVGSGSGSAQVILFLAHWCPACQAEVPSLVRVLGDVGVPAGVEVVAVLTGFDASRPNWPPFEWLDREGLTAGTYGSGVVRVVRDDAQGTAMETFGISSYPGWAVVSPSGEVAARFSGVIDREGIVAILSQAAGLS